MAEVDGKLDVPVIIVNVMVFFLPVEHVGNRVFEVCVQSCSLCVKESHHHIWWQVVIKGLQNFVILLLQLLSVNCISYVLCFLPYVYMFDRAFGRGWIKSGECCFLEGLR